MNNEQLVTSVNIHIFYVLGWQEYHFSYFSTGIKLKLIKMWLGVLVLENSKATELNLKDTIWCNCKYILLLDFLLRLVNSNKISLSICYVKGLNYDSNGSKWSMTRGIQTRGVAGESLWVLLVRKRWVCIGWQIVNWLVAKFVVWESFNTLNSDKMHQKPKTFVMRHAKYLKPSILAPVQKLLSLSFVRTTLSSHEHFQQLF